MSVDTMARLYELKNIIGVKDATGNLDRESGLNILRILKELNKEGKTVIMITHN